MNNIKVIVDNAKVCGLTAHTCKNGSKLQRFGVSLGWNKNQTKNRYINCLYFGDTEIDKNRPISFEGTLINNQFMLPNGQIVKDINIRISSFTQPTMLGVDDKKFEEDLLNQNQEQEQVVLEKQPTDIAPQIEEDDMSQWFNEGEIENGK